MIALATLVTNSVYMYVYTYIFNTYERFCFSVETVMVKVSTKQTSKKCCKRV